VTRSARISTWCGVGRFSSKAVAAWYVTRNEREELPGKREDVVETEEGKVDVDVENDEIGDVEVDASAGAASEEVAPVGEVSEAGGERAGAPSRNAALVLLPPSLSIRSSRVSALNVTFLNHTESVS
jgi:hypothetical protein